MTTYNVTIGTEVSDDEPLAVARATNALREAPVSAITGVATHGGGDQQYGVSLLVESDAPAEAFDEYAETVEVV